MTEETHKLLKKLADQEGISMSEKISKWVWEEEHKNTQVKINREWVYELDAETLERLLLYCDQNHFLSPAQAITSFIWKAKVDTSGVRGQMSFYK